MPSGDNDYNPHFRSATPRDFYVSSYTTSFTSSQNYYVAVDNSLSGVRTWYTPVYRESSLKPVEYCKFSAGASYPIFLY